MTREEAKEWLPRPTIISTHSDENHPDNKPWMAYEMALKALEQEPKTDWIPISESLPEEKQSVLVWCPEYKNMYCAYLENKNWWIFGAFSQIIPNAVIAWMPLPEPYKPQESEDKE